MIMEIELPADRKAPSKARRTLRELRGEIADQCDLMELLVTEVITNAILHSGAEARAPLALCLNLDPAVVRVEVTDPGPGFDRDHLADPELMGTGRRGLFLLDELSDRWGVESNGHGNTVWFELDRRKNPAA